MKQMVSESFKKSCDDMTELIISCWDSNQELDENGNPVDGLTFDERLAKKIENLEGQDKLVMDQVVGW